MFKVTITERMKDTFSAKVYTRKGLFSWVYQHTLESDTWFGARSAAAASIKELKTYPIDRGVIYFDEYGNQDSDT